MAILKPRLFYRGTTTYNGTSTVRITLTTDGESKLHTYSCSIYAAEQFLWRYEKGMGMKALDYLKKHGHLI